MSNEYTLPAVEGQVIGLRFHEGHFYKWSDKLHAWGMVDDQAAPVALQTIATTLSELPFAVALSAALNAQEGSHATH